MQVKSNFSSRREGEAISSDYSTVVSYTQRGQEGGRAVARKGRWPRWFLYNYSSVAASLATVGLLDTIIKNRDIHRNIKGSTLILVPLL